MNVDYLLLQLEEHEKALKILVHKLKDYTAAETYCLVNAKDGAYKRKLFHILLSVYLDPSYEWVAKISILETKKNKKLQTRFEDRHFGILITWDFVAKLSGITSIGN